MASAVKYFSAAFLFAITISAAPVTFALRDADGRLHTDSELAGHAATVLVFLATDCVNSNSYAVELGRLHRDYESRKVAFYAVYPDPAETPATVQKHDREYAIPFPALLDPQQILARATGARVTPEAVVLSSTGEVLYRGRIDDRFAGFGKTRIHVDKHDLRTALDDILAGKRVSNPIVPALGCAIPGVNP